MPKETQFEVLSITGNDTVVRATLSDGETVVEQTIANVPVHDEQETRLFLGNYFKAYEAGLKVEQAKEREVTVAEGLIGKKMTPIKPEEMNYSVV